MADLFPKVTGYFFVHEILKSIDVKKSMLGMAVIAGTIGGLLHMLANLTKGLAAMLTGLISGIVAGVVMGYVIWATSIVVMALGAAVVSMSMSIEQKDTKRKIIAILNGFDPSFSYEYFVSQIVATLKIILFSKD